jgi:hypothetical protein
MHFNELDFNLGFNQKIKNKSFKNLKNIGRDHIMNIRPLPKYLGFGKGTFGKISGF